MLTVNYFDARLVDDLVERAREYLGIYSYRKELDEVEIPFREMSTGEIRYVQFAMLAGNWVFVRIR